MTHFDKEIMPRIKQMWYDGEIREKCDSCGGGLRWSLQTSEWKSNTKHVEYMARLKLELKETPTPITKATERRRNIDETLIQHDVRALRERKSILGGLWLFRRQADPEALRACQNTLWPAEELTKETVLSTGRTSELRCKVIVDQTDTRKVRVTRHCWTLAASLGRTHVTASERVR